MLLVIFWSRNVISLRSLKSIRRATKRSIISRYNSLELKFCTLWNLQMENITNPRWFFCISSSANRALIQEILNLKHCLGKPNGVECVFESALERVIAGGMCLQISPRKRYCWYSPKTVGLDFYSNSKIQKLGRKSYKVQLNYNQFCVCTALGPMWSLNRDVIWKDWFGAFRRLWC